MKVVFKFFLDGIEADCFLFSVGVILKLKEGNYGN
jgi:hypothetical protein